MTNKTDLKNKKIILIGIGGVGKCISYYLDKFFIFNYDNFYMIDKDETQCQFITIQNLLSKGAHFIHKNIKSTYKSFFNELLNSGDIVIDCTARTPCIKWLRHLSNLNIYYVNTSIEEEEIKKAPSKKTTVYENSISKQHKQILKLQETTKGRFLIEYGTNPGLITSFCYKALDDMYDYLVKNSAPEHKTILSELKNNYAKLAYTLGITEIHCSEIDTQIGGQINRNIFNNTWSAVGLLDELSEGSEIYLGENSAEQINALKPQSILAKYIDDNDVLLTKTKSLHNKGKSICYTGNINNKTLKIKKANKLNNKKDFAEITGYLIHHGEILDIGTMLKYRNFAPTVYYVYDINIEADNDIKKRGLENIHKESYDSTKVNVMNVYNNKLSGTDNIGIFIKCKNEMAWWCGSVLETDYTKKELNDKYFGPTVIQVMCGVLGGLTWLLEQPKGIYFGRNVNHNMVLTKMAKYLNIKSELVCEPKKLYN